MALRTTYANLADGLQPFSLWDASLSDMGHLGVTPCTAAGTNTIVLTPISTAFAPAVSTPPQQLQQFSFVAVGTSTTSVTINGLKLYKEDGATQAAANDILTNVLYGIVYNSALNSAAGGYQIAFPITSILNPVISGATITGSTITTSTYNGNTWTAGTGILTIAAAKTLTANNTITLAGTDGTTMTFPTTNATIARTDAANTFTGTQTIGALVATTLNGNTFTAGSYTLSGTAAKILNFTASLTLSGTDATVMTFPTTSATLARTDAANTFTGHQTFEGVTATGATGSGLMVFGTGPALTTPAIGAATGTSINLTGGGITFSTSGQGHVGTTTNDNANAGVVGEYIEVSVLLASAVALVSGTPKTIATLPLTAGDWEVDCVLNFNPSAAPSITALFASLSLVTNTLDLTVGRFTGGPMAAVLPGTVNFGVPVPPLRFSLSAGTNIFMVAQSTFTNSLAGYGIVRARRPR